MQLLRDLGERHAPERNLQVLFDEILQAAISVADAAAGTLQLLDETTNELVLLTTRGIDRRLCQAFARVDAGSNTSCGIALRTCTRTLVHFDAPGAPDPHGSLRMHVEAGLRSAQSTPMRSRSGKAIGMISTHWRDHHVPSEQELRFMDRLARRAADLIERRRSEELLRDSEARFRLLIESVAQAVWEADGNGQTVVDSPSWRRYTGQSTAEWLGEGWLDAIHPDDRENVMRTWRQCVLERRNVDAEFRLRHADGSWRWTNVKATPMIEADGSVRKWIGMNIDITERKNAEAALHDADRRKDEFLATLAHELRNPLAPLRHGIQISRVTGRADPQLQGVVDMMDRQLSHLVRLVDDLLDVGRIRSGKLELKRRPVGLAEILRSSVEAVRSHMDAKQQEFRLDARDPDLRVVADFDRLVQVFTNLLSNASKYSEPGSLIHMRLERAGHEAVIVVADHGIGIPTAELPHVFDLFSQVRAHQGRADGGLGIGLSIVRSLVALHGGSVSACSDGPGLGSTFTVRLPLVAEEHRAAAGLPSGILFDDADAAIVPLSILVADDNVDAGDSLATLLRLQGHEVRVARDGLEAVERARVRAPDLILLDLGMPRMDGIDATRHLRRLPGGDKFFIVAVTGWGQAGDRQRTRDAGFDLHLVKPIDEHALLGAIERAGRVSA